ncbi:MIP family channel protein [Cereibacter sphaeroides]|uniref:MIP family channel protein n=1 Tax=Rhodobacterales TaxID=204455 RepID=UPI000BBF34E4|nr:MULTISPECIES: MIP family channel protein [Paracoccaceae]MCE6962165.1 MIP family channel protein [Cereibacter sphaeroides]MCE6972104.1 MIP family channel protein [Cereibacter sphaeroides]
MTKKLMAEVFGTFILVFFGCGSAVLMGEQIGMLGISIAFGLAIVAAAYSIGAISGAHLNPAVSLGFLMSGRMSAGEFAGYVLAQIAGAILGALVVFLIASGKTGYSLAVNGLGQNGFGPGYLGEYTMGAALIFELVATFVFVCVILAATASHVSAASTALAGLAIGLTLAAIHLVGINVTGVSVNPARSIGPAIFVGGKAIADLWVFIVAPLAGGAAAGLAHASGFFRPAGVQAEAKGRASAV